MDRSLNRSLDLVAAQDFVPAGHLLESLLRQQGYGTAEGCQLAYLLLTVYEREGRYESALHIVTLLLKTPLVISASPEAPTVEEIRAQQQLMQHVLTTDAHLQVRLAEAQDPAVILALHGALAENRLRSQEAAADYTAAYSQLIHEAHPSEAAAFFVEKYFFALLKQTSMPSREKLKIVVAYGRRLHADLKLSPERHLLALSMLPDLTFSSTLDYDPQHQAPTFTAEALQDLSEDLNDLNMKPFSADPNDKSLHAYAAKLRPRVAEYRAAVFLNEAVKSESRGDWAGAASAYQTVIHFASETPDVLKQSLPLRRMETQAERSVFLMQKIAAGATSAVTPPTLAPSDGLAVPDGLTAQDGFVGIDHTIGPNWQGRVGKEGWVLFSAHRDDLCGGPRLLDRSFSYQAYLGDASNQVRRWRDPPGWWTRIREDLPLDDPLVPGDHVLSSIDDNGEEYPTGAGPDLYFRLAIPSGIHLLSLPLHFSFTMLPAQHPVCGFYLFSDAPPSGQAWTGFGKTGTSSLGDQASAEATLSAGTTQCLSTRIVSLGDAPGCLRAVLHGPAHYTLILRRLSSYCGTLPALFLDPDPRAAKPALADEFTSDDLPSLGLAIPDPASGVPVPAVPYGTPTAALWQLTGDYGAASASSEPAPPLMASTNFNVHKPSAQEERWQELAARADRLVQDAQLSPVQKSAAAWIAWQASEQAVLTTDRSEHAFSRYLMTRYEGSEESQTASLSSHQLSDLQALAEGMRREGKISKAEQIDDLVWSSALSARPVGTGKTSAGAWRQQLAALWSAVMRPYTARQSARLWEGIGGPAARPVTLAVDAGYAAQHAQAVSAALLEMDLPAKGTQTAVSSKTPVSSQTAASSEDGFTHIAFTSPGAQEARKWLDQVAGEQGLSINGDISSSPAAATVEQPVGPLIYVFACLPLLSGAEASTLADELLGNQAPKKMPKQPSVPQPSDPSVGDTAQPVRNLDPCLLRADQLELLARALLETRSSEGRMNSDKAALAGQVLRQLKKQYPAYPRMDQVAHLLKTLAPASSETMKP